MGHDSYGRGHCGGRKNGRNEAWLIVELSHERQKSYSLGSEISSHSDASP